VRSNRTAAMNRLSSKNTLGLDAGASHSSPYPTDVETCFWMLHVRQLQVNLMNLFLTALP
jgi:hypothetical protein